MRRLALLLIVLYSCAPLLWGAGAASAQDPVSEILRLVNQARAEVGAAPLGLNSALTRAAQDFTEWRTQASVITHTGPNGSTPRSRANAAGYYKTYVGENIVEGGLMTPDAAVRWWRGSPVHYRNMTSTNYQDAGIGYTITESGYKRYTLLMGGGGVQRPPSSSSGAASSGGGGGAEDAAGAEDAGDAPEQPVISPVVKATPRADGAIIHVVEPGQALWTIAAVYQVDINRLLELNELYEGSYIRAGDEIVVDPGSMPPRPKPPLVHVVQAGETLWTLAAIYHVGLDELMALNGLHEDDLIHVGNEIIIRPGSAPTPAPAAELPTATEPPPTATETPAATTPPDDATAAPIEAPRTATMTPTQAATGTPDTGGGSGGLLEPESALTLGVVLLAVAGLVALVGFTLERRQRR